MTLKTDFLNFNSLISSIQTVNDNLSAQAGKAVNISLTLRNWIIGAYIAEYEQNGKDRAEYGENLLETLSLNLKSKNVPSVSARSLRLYRRFYSLYPQIWQTLSAKSDGMIFLESIWQTVSAKSNLFLTKISDQIQESTKMLPGEILLERLSFSHFAELLTLDDQLQRKFYEIECVKGNWSVRELKRQMGSLLYERSGLSNNKEKLIEQVQSGIESTEPKLCIRDPYVFEFLGIKPREVMAESVLEDALLDKLQEFLLELGHGFCFEARQKRILIGETHCFVDLVFYHRILKCHVLVELKLAAFNHENLGQLNTYVSWFKKNMMTEGDNPPVGILLCTQKDHTLVEYALAGMDNNLFVSKYKLELPEKEEMQQFIEKQMQEVG